MVRFVSNRACLVENIRYGTKRHDIEVVEEYSLILIRAPDIKRGMTFVQVQRDGDLDIDLRRWTRAITNEVRNLN